MAAQTFAAGARKITGRQLLHIETRPEHHLPAARIVSLDYGARLATSDDDAASRRCIYLRSTASGTVSPTSTLVCRAIRTRGHFSSDEAAAKQLYLILNRSEKDWAMPPREWAMAKAQFAVIFGDRFVRALAA